MSATARLFVPPVVQEPLESEAPVVAWTAEDVKEALRRRHPGADVGGMSGQWTCIAEWRGIDLLALNAWQKADVIGYEVKVSRSDLRRELLKPHKRAGALAITTEFYLAVPEKLLSADEVLFEEPEWEDGDFEREHCPGVPEFGPEMGSSWHPHKRYGGRCAKWGSRDRKHCVPVPIPEVIVVPDWLVRGEGESEEEFNERVDRCYRMETRYAPCWNCGGRGYLQKSRVEREAPTCWVPRDVGLVTVSKRGCRVVKSSPKRKEPKSIAGSRQQINDLVRWVSHRPDPRHR